MLHLQDAVHSHIHRVTDKSVTDMIVTSHEMPGSDTTTLGCTAITPATLADSIVQVEELRASCHSKQLKNALLLELLHT